MASQDAFGDVKSRSRWAIFMGLVTAALGVFLFLYPHITATLTTVAIGWTLILAGIAQLGFAITSGSVGQFLWKVLAGLLYGGVGIMLTGMPDQGATAVTGALGSLFFAQGIIEAIIAFRLWPVDGWGWVFFDAVWALLLGVLILAQWPSSSAWAIGTLVGASLFVGGISRAMVAGKIRGFVTGVSNVAHAQT